MDVLYHRFKSTNLPLKLITHSRTLFPCNSGSYYAPKMLNMNDFVTNLFNSLIKYNSFEYINIKYHHAQNKEIIKIFSNFVYNILCHKV